MLEALRLLLKAEGFKSETAASPAAVVTAIGTRDFDVVLMDLNYARDTTSGAEGLELLARIQEIDATLPVVVMTAWGSVDLAVEAMRRGARDFVQKPWENPRLLATLRTRSPSANAAAGPASGGRNILRREPISSQSPSMKPVLEMIARQPGCQRAHPGENGTGGRRGPRPAASDARRTGDVERGNFEASSSELFGRQGRSPTRADRVGRFELADGGTLA